MHFSIPDTSDVSDSNGSSFSVFNVHINGVYHCSVRYKLFHNFHEQLKKEFGPSILPVFPPKKLLALSPSQLEERRSILERYIQIVSQNPTISGSNTFNSFLLSAQQHSQKENPEDANLDVFLMNGHKISVNIISTDQTDDVLETIASKIELPDDYVYYFGLYLVKKESSGDTVIVRKLQEFESPFISLKAANQNGSHRIVVRKSYWDPSYDDDLIEDRVAMQLIHVQAVSDVERDWVSANKDQMLQLETLQKRNSKKEYLRYVRTLKFYGYIQFKPCPCDYPESNSKAVISAGDKQLTFRIQVQQTVKEVSFKVTRMRCWRITSVYPETNGDAPETDTSKAAYSQLELSFEYLMCKDTLQWITVTSDQAILMSMCLQGMVDELIQKKQGKRMKRPSDREHSRRRQQTRTAPLQSPQSSSGTERQISGSSVKRSVSTSSYMSGGALTENEVFSREDGIGDEDL